MKHYFCDISAIFCIFFKSRFPIAYFLFFLVFYSLLVQVFIGNGFSLSVNLDILLYVESKFVKDVKKRTLVTLHRLVCYLFL